MPSKKSLPSLSNSLPQPQASRSGLLTTAVLLCLPGFGAAQTPQFSPVPLPEHVYDGGWEHYVGGGVASFDCNGDALPELYAAGGANPALLLLNGSTPGGALSFTAADTGPHSLTEVTGAYPLDIDGDRILDLVVLRAGPDQLLRGLGECQFAPYDSLGFQTGPHWTTAFSATWETGETRPTLAFGTYVDRTDPNGPFGTCDDTLLYRPAGENYGTPQALSPGFCALSALFSDWKRTGQADLRLSNDRHYYVRGGEEQMWAMEPAPRLYGPEDGWQSYALWGMGIAARDINGDGHQDVYLTSMGDQKLQMFDAGSDGPVWHDVTYEYGTTAHRPYTGGDGRPSTGWHAAFGDVNNDGREDIFVAKGNVEQMPVAAQKDPNNLLLQRADGRFEEVGAEAGVASLHRGRGAALVDLNLDGQLDLAVVNRRAPMELWQNQGSVGNWLLVNLEGPAHNAYAIGAFVELDLGDRTVFREITVGGGHAGGPAGDQHFGLGTQDKLRLRVIWPDGSEGKWHDLRSNQRVTIRH